MVNIYETAGDLTIDLSRSKGENGNYFPELKEKYNLANLTKFLTYFKAQRGKVVFRRQPFVKPG